MKYSSTCYLLRSDFAYIPCIFFPPMVDSTNFILENISVIAKDYLTALAS